MSKKMLLVSASFLSATLFVASSSPAQALVVRQSQEMSNSSSVKVEGSNVSVSGDFKAEAKSESWGKQSQKVVIDDGAGYTMRPYGHSKGRGNKGMWAKPASSGEVRLTWDMRGGTCFVRYTEAGSAGYNYETSTGCDNGTITIGGLTPGRNYRFQVRKDDGAWSQPITVKAW
mgnify:CR=1 FL=1